MRKKIFGSRKMKNKRIEFYPIDNNKSDPYRKIYHTYKVTSVSKPDGQAFLIDRETKINGLPSYNKKFTYPKVTKKSINLNNQSSISAKYKKGE